VTIVLGVDLGISAANPTGVAIVDTDAMRIGFTFAFVPRADDWQARVRLVARHLRGVLAAHTVDLIAYEMPSAHNNIMTGLKLAHVAGTVIAAADLYDVPTVAVSVVEGKIALSGWSTATKADQIGKVKQVFSVDLPKDISDAVGVALAGEAVWRRRLLGAA
jgi:crossover junction endodeoxyribonuclease RuvC